MVSKRVKIMDMDMGMGITKDAPFCYPLKDLILHNQDYMLVR